ncbi:phosphoserine phosphatase SerB [Aurantimonas endophytica]|uniref:Phosphoserine phosphatase n=1 Tax=Aurantimonas endophytica TaxID=1522175 RepID=A0A7W6MNS2_9HYPH|nr:phosphoserine phosphatase SerB [Aurantimonas endophytica]MBB4002250.1 phosphoserine phosphatase [Aurantimonas endophytica]MCO6402124.1 phosphoserine phosphatase SerB [Aurantimonas endophytica]
MFVATLIAAPSGPGLPAGAVGEIAGRLGASADETTWLDEGYAVDIGFETPVTAAQSEEMAGIAAASAFDCVLQERAGRRKRFLIADMDSTMIDQECIDELAAEIGIKDRVAAITARAMNGEIAFEPALRERVALLAGLPESIIGQVIAERITLASGGGALVATMRASGAHTALVSGGFTVFTGPIAERLGFHENRANRLLAADGRLTGEVAEPILGAAAKVEALRDIAGRLGIGTEHVLAVGDGANDLPMLELAGSGVALHAKPAVAARARHRIDHGDLTALLFLQGYRRDEFRH